MALSQCHPELTEGCYLIPKRLRQAQPDNWFTIALSQCHPELVEGCFLLVNVGNREWAPNSWMPAYPRVEKYFLASTGSALQTVNNVAFAMSPWAYKGCYLILKRLRQAQLSKEFQWHFRNATLSLSKGATWFLKGFDRLSLTIDLQLHFHNFILSLSKSGTKWPNHVVIINLKELIVIKVVNRLIVKPKLHKGLLKLSFFCHGENHLIYTKTLKNNSLNIFFR